jgi:hypothetical protein
MDEMRARVARTVLLAVALGLLVACAGTARNERAANGPPVTFGAHDAEGQAAARNLQTQYDDTRPDCRKDASDPNPLPAILCSGVLLRATKRGAAYDIWNPNLGSVLKRGVSFSWLRKDSAFSGVVFGYTNGFVILPYFSADSVGDNYTRLTVLCIYPFDADTYNRPSGTNDGCGPHSAQAGTTGPCQAQGIQNAQQWLAKFGAVANRYQQQCGFTLLPGTAGAYLAFQAQASIRASQPQHFGLQNEVMVGTWAQNDARLPIEAFFYLSGNAAGLNEARLNQHDYNAMARRWVPVIRSTLPTVANGPAKFEYVVTDQQIP